jgi:hypothetical protein
MDSSIWCEVEISTIDKEIRLHSLLVSAVIWPGYAFPFSVKLLHAEFISLSYIRMSSIFLICTECKKYKNDSMASQRRILIFSTRWSSGSCPSVGQLDPQLHKVPAINIPGECCQIEANLVYGLANNKTITKNAQTKTFKSGILRAKATVDLIHALRRRAIHLLACILSQRARGKRWRCQELSVLVMLP